MARISRTDYLIAFAILAAVGGYSRLFAPEGADRSWRTLVALPLALAATVLTGLTMVALVLLYRRAKARIGAWREGRKSNRSAADLPEWYKK